MIPHPLSTPLTDTRIPSPPLFRALGRALVRKPQVFLLDEPLSNLDATLRMSMRVEIARLHRQLGATMVYVTHDQIDAMTLGPRIVVLDKGRKNGRAACRERGGRSVEVRVGAVTCKKKTRN